MIELLEEIRNLLRWQVAHTKPFGQFGVPSEGAPSYEEQEKKQKELIDLIAQGEIR